MADQAVAEETVETDELEAIPAEGRMPGKKLVLFIVLPLLLLLGGGGGGAYFTGLLDPLLGVTPDLEAEAPPEVVPSVYFELPEMLVNLNNGGRKTSYLKITVSLEVEDQAGVDHINKILPRVVDSFQVYLRELRIEDLSGSAGLQRLREELLLRVNAAAHPTVVRDVLFKEMLVQ
jgi:flagellar FliL protein